MLPNILSSRIGALMLVLVLGMMGAGVWLDNEKEQKGSHLLAGLDLSDGEYILVIQDGTETEVSTETHTAQSESRLARLIDDRDVIAKYRGAVDIKSSIVEFLPGEGRGDYYVLLFRNGRQVAGRSVPSATQIQVPSGLRQAGRLVRERRLQAGCDVFLPALERLQSRNVLFRDVSSPKPGDCDYPYYFSLTLPTVVVPDGEAFDVDAYVRERFEQIAADVHGHALRFVKPVIAVSSSGQISLVDDRYHDLSYNGEPLVLAGFTLYDIRVTVEGDAGVYSALRDLNLHRYMAPPHRPERLEQAKTQALSRLGLDTMHEEIIVSFQDKHATGYEYRPDGVLGRQYPRVYVGDYWEAVVPSAQ